MHPSVTYRLHEDGVPVTGVQFTVYESDAAQEIWRYTEFGMDMWIVPLQRAYDTAFLADSGDLLITIGPAVAPAGMSQNAVRFYTRDEVVALSFDAICRYPRRLYPGERRPWITQDMVRPWQRLPQRRWWTDATYAHGVLWVETTGISSCRIDVRAFLRAMSEGADTTQALAHAAEFPLNVATIVRWAVYAVITVPAALVVLWSSVRLVRELVSGYRRRRAPEGCCPQCGYPAYGLREPRCPECGTPLSADILAAAQPPAPTKGPLRYGALMAVGVGILAHIGMLELRRLALRYAPTVAGTVGLEGWNGQDVGALYTRWWCSDLAIAVLPMILAVLVYRAARSRH